MWQESQQAKNLKNIQPSSIVVNLGDDDDDEVDPTHNKGLAIEIFDKKAKAAKPEVSLAEMFKAKRKDLAVKSEQQDKHAGQDVRQGGF